MRNKFNLKPLLISAAYLAYSITCTTQPHIIANVHMQTTGVFVKCWYLATFLVGHIVGVTVLVHEGRTLDTQLRLEGAGQVVDAGMDHPTVVTRLVRRCHMSINR